MNDKKQLYIIEWSYPYNKEWKEMQEAIVEVMVDNSDLKEARALLKQIMDQ
jgi:hypothetical protein